MREVTAMVRPLRIDYPGAWQSVGNRGIAKRSIFESDREMKYFLSLIAWKVHAGEIEVHAYCLMLNHFHMLVRSPVGMLSRAMQGIQDKYAARFNRQRDRDGHLFKGRFWSKLIHGLAYRVNAFRYIEENPVRAGLVVAPRDYAYGSAWHYAQSRRPPWLSTRFGDELLASRIRFGRGRADASDENDSRTRELMSRLFKDPSPCSPDLDELLARSSQRTKEWMLRRAKLADGVPPGLVLAHPKTIQELIALARMGRPKLRTHISQRPESAWNLLEPGLLRTVCGLPLNEIAARLGRHNSTISERIGRHRQALLIDPEYASIAAEVTHRALRRDWQV